MEKLAILLKSFRGDLAYAERLVASFHEHNVDALRMFVVVPPEDIDLFEPLSAPTVQILSEALLSTHLVAVPLGDLRPGYANQEIVKLAFWELELAENYLCVDSDAMFIRDFQQSDFMADADTPYTVLVEDHELAVEPRYYREHWQQRRQSIARIQRELGLSEKVMLTCHGHQVMSSNALRAFRDQILIPRGWDYRDALAVSPYEFSWYNMWLQASGVMPIHPREPYAKVFHHEGHHFEYLLRGVTLDDIARGYLLLVINSNYSRDLGLIDPEASKPESLAPYLSYGEAFAVLAAKARDTWRRRGPGRSRRG